MNHLRHPIADSGYSGDARVERRFDVRAVPRCGNMVVLLHPRPRLLDDEAAPGRDDAQRAVHVAVACHGHVDGSLGCVDQSARDEVTADFVRLRRAQQGDVRMRSTKCGVCHARHHDLAFHYRPRWSASLSPSAGWKSGELRGLAAEPDAAGERRGAAESLALLRSGRVSENADTTYFNG